MSTEFIVELQAMTFGGDALGRLPDGRAVFVPFGLPGETVKIRLTENKATFAKGEIGEIITPSPLRIKPLCPHFGSCGGCNYQHLAYCDQLEIKQKIVVDQLKRLAGLVDFPVNHVVASPSPWNYRNTVQFRVSPAGKLGYQRANSNAFVEIKECHLPQENINTLWPQLDFDENSGIDRAILREGADADMILGLESKQEQPPEFSVDFPISVVYTGPEGLTVFSGEEFVVMEVNGRSFKVSMGSFFQANTLQAEAMVKHVLQLAGDLDGKTVVDAYCGVGLFSAFLAPQVKQLIGIELSESSCNDYAVNMDEFNNVDLYIGTVEQVLPSLSITPEIVVVDPPRVGLDQLVVNAIAKLQPEKIIYVSCDPATLARDIKRFALLGYSLTGVTPFDQFPQTYHIETVSLLEKQA
ncbi:MAG: class I SAM-dependent RNA methyltransferase [Anaerolineaceae bacterium]